MNLYSPKKPRLMALAIIVTLSLTGCGNASYVKQGDIGLLINDMTGQIEQTLEPGYRMTIPFQKHLVSYPITDQQYVMVHEAGEGQTQGDDSVQVNSLEGQTFNVDASVEYRLSSKDAVPALYKKYGGKDFEEIVDQYYRSKFKAEIANAFASMPLAQGITGPGRKNAEAVAMKALQDDMASDNITITHVLIRAVHIPDAIAKSIQSKTNAENELVQAKTAAQQQVVEAQASAQAKLIAARAEAESRKEVGLSPAQYTQIETAKITADAIKNSKNLVIMPANSLIDARSLIGNGK